MMLKKFIKNEYAPFAVVLLGALLYVIGFTILTFWKLHHFYYDNLDLAIFNNVFFNTLRGSPFVATIHPPSYLGDHFSPIIFLLVGIYALKPGPEILLFLQTITLAVTAIPIYCIARILLKEHSKWFSVFPALLWLVNPLVHNMSFFEFELVPYAMLLLFCAMYFYLKKQKILFIIFVLLALMVREDIAFIVLFISALAWVDKRSLFWKLSPMLMAVVYSMISFPIISLFNAAGSYKFIIYYNWLGGDSLPTIALSFLAHPIQLLTHFFTIRNMEFILGMSFPFLFTVFAPSAYLLLLVAPLAQIELAGAGGSAIIFMTHYSGLFLVSLVLVFIMQIKKIASGKFPHFIPKTFRNRKFVLLLIAGACVYASLTYGSIVPAVKAWQIYHQQDQKERLVRMIPSGAPVASTFELLSSLSTREKIYSFHYAAVGKNQYGQIEYPLPADTEYLAIDWHDFLKAQIHFSTHYIFGTYAQNVPKNLREILSNFDLISTDGSIMLFKKNVAPNTHKDLVLFKKLPDAVPAIQEPTITKIDTDSSTFTMHMALPPDVTDAKYYITITTPYREFMLPLAYALPIPSGSAQELTMPIYIGSSEQKNSVIKLYRWHKGFLSLGQLKNLNSSTDAELLQTIPITTPGTP